MPEWVFWFLPSPHWVCTVPLSPFHTTPQTGDTCGLRLVYQCSLAAAQTGVSLTLGCASGQTSMTLPQLDSLLSGDTFYVIIVLIKVIKYRRGNGRQLYLLTCLVPLSVCSTAVHMSQMSLVPWGQSPYEGQSHPPPLSPEKSTIQSIIHRYQ